MNTSHYLLLHSENIRARQGGAAQQANMVNL